MPIIQEPVKRKLYRGFSTINNPFGKWRQTDLEALKQDLTNHFQIRKGEKLMNPEFGSNIPLMVMEPLDERTRDAAISDVKDVVNNDPRLKASAIDLREFDQGMQINIEMIYPEYDATDTINLKFNR
jgi:phage baseplate assembly protein W